MSDISAIATSAATTSSSTTTATSSALNADTFLQLLMTQLTHQNPLDPADPTEFTSQLVNYASLEQQISANTQLESLATQLGALSAASAVSYLGATAEIATASAPVQSGQANWSYTLDADASSVALTVLNSDGEIVYSGEGDTSAGAHSFSLDASELADVENGDTLTLVVTALDSSGATIDASISARARIDSFESADGVTVYQAGELQFTADDITRLLASAN